MRGERPPVWAPDAEWLPSRKGSQSSSIHPRPSQAHDGPSEAWNVPYQAPGSLWSGDFVFHRVAYIGGSAGDDQSSSIICARGNDAPPTCSPWCVVLSNSRTDLLNILDPEGGHFRSAEAAHTYEAERPISRLRVETTASSTERPARNPQTADSLFHGWRTIHRESRPMMRLLRLSENSEDHFG